MTSCSEASGAEIKFFRQFQERIGLFQQKEELFHFLTNEFADTFCAKGSVLFLKKAESSEWVVRVASRVSPLTVSSLLLFAQDGCGKESPLGNRISFPKPDGGELMVRLGENGLDGCILFILKEKRNDWSEEELSMVSLAANYASLSIENLALREELDGKRICRVELPVRLGSFGLIGESFLMKGVCRLIDSVKETTSTTLVTGETGTGKELVARAIHFLGRRREKSFIAHNCGATPDTLIESELFGHTRGAFTGATSDKKGLFEIADGGTFFLDEIADMSPMMQIRILRILQEGEFRRVGETQPRRVDVRVITATNKNLEEEMEKGNFRGDLYFRLNVVRIRVPPLRERVEDIPLLSEHFRGKACLKFGKEMKGFSNNAIEALMGYSWPGNVRELENEIERAVLLTPQGAMIVPEIFSETLRVKTSPAFGKARMSRGSLKEMRQKIERMFVLEALAKHKGNKSRCARELGLTRQGLIKKLKSFNQSPQFS